MGFHPAPVEVRLANPTGTFPPRGLTRRGIKGEVEWRGGSGDVGVDQRWKGGEDKGGAQEPPRAGWKEAMDRRRIGGYTPTVWKEPGSRSPYEDIA